MMLFLVAVVFLLLMTAVGGQALSRVAAPEDGDL